jgi:hypothetical protein
VHYWLHARCARRPKIGSLTTLAPFRPSLLLLLLCEGGPHLHIVGCIAGFIPSSYTRQAHLLLFVCPFYEGVFGGIPERALSQGRRPRARCRDEVHIIINPSGTKAKWSLGLQPYMGGRVSRRYRSCIGSPPIKGLMMSSNLARTVDSPSAGSTARYNAGTDSTKNALEFRPAELTVLHMHVEYRTCRENRVSTNSHNGSRSNAAHFSCHLNFFKSLLPVSYRLATAPPAEGS